MFFSDSLRDKEIIASRSVIELAVVKRVDHEFSGVAKALQDLKRFFIDTMCAKVLCHGTIIIVVQSIVAAGVNCTILSRLNRGAFAI